MTTSPDQLFQFGGVPVGGGLGSIALGAGDVYWVNAAEGAAKNDGKTPGAAKTILGDAYDLTTNNNNDIVILVADSSGAQIGESTDSSGLTWSNSYTHLVGATAPTMTNKRARIFHNFNASPTWTISGSGCSFENFYFSHGRGSTINIIGTQISGGRNYFGNVHFAGPQNDTEADEATYRVVVLASGASDLTFERCVFGHDTINRSAANTSLEFAGVQHSYIINSDFISMADASTPTHILVGATGIDRFLIMEGVAMINSGTSLTQAIDSNITDTTNRKIIIKPPFFVVGADDVADATGDGTIWTQRFTATANVLGLGLNVAVS